MKRVLIIGNCGSGKSTLSTKLSIKTKLPVIHLDKEYWQAGWKETPKDEWEKKVAKLIRRDQYIMDGNYRGTLALRLGQADTLIYLQYPSLKCFWRVLKRIFKHHGKTRPDMHPGCPERFDLDFLHYVLAFKWIVGVRIEKTLNSGNCTAKLIRLKNDKAVSEYLDSI